jgi:hypothetical protein
MSQWQHESPINCPEAHPMHWLGGLHWVCTVCHKQYDQLGPLTEEDLAAMRGGLYSARETGAEHGK